MYCFHSVSIRKKIGQGKKKGISSSDYSIPTHVKINIGNGHEQCVRNDNAGTRKEKRKRT